jgi:hypothetical protein
MSKNIDPFGGTLEKLTTKAAAARNPQSVVSSSKKPEGLHGQGVLVATFTKDRFASGALAIGVYDLEEQLPANAFVSGPSTLDVLENKAGAGTLSVRVGTGGTPVAAGTAGKTNPTTAGSFAIGSAIGGSRIYAVVTVGTVTAGSFVVRIPYTISGV